MRMHEILSANAATRSSRGKTPELDHLRVHEAESGGHVVEHYYEAAESHPYREPEQHVFAQAEAGSKKPKLPREHILTHIAKHLNIPHETLNLDHEADGHEAKKSKHERETEEDGEYGDE